MLLVTKPQAVIAVATLSELIERVKDNMLQNRKR